MCPYAGTLKLKCYQDFLPPSSMEVHMLFYTQKNHTDKSAEFQNLFTKM